MEEGIARHVPPQWRAASPVISMLNVLKQAKSAFSLLSADEIRKQAELPVHIGLVADSSGAYAEMEDFLVLSTLPRQEWRRRLTQVHRANDVEVPAHVDIVLYEPGLPCPEGAYTPGTHPASSPAAPASAQSST